MATDWRVERFDLEELPAVESVQRLLAPAEKMLDASFSSAVERRKALMRLTRGQRMLYAVNTLEVTVNGDGFDHYFFYGGADSVIEAAEGLREFGAPAGFGRALAEACKVFPGGRVPTDWDEREELVERLQDEGGDVFGPMDEMFLGAYEQEEGLADCGVDYVKRHPKEFFR